MELNLELVDDLFFNDKAVFMRAYCDESGLHKNAVVISIYGLLMSKETCKSLERRWHREANKNPKIPLPFHMSDCVVGSKAYAHLNEDVRVAMQRRLIRCFKGLDILAAGVSAVKIEYASVSDQIRPNEAAIRDPWFFVFEGAIAKIMFESARAGKPHVISFVFEAQDQFEDRAHQLYKTIRDDEETTYRDRLGTISFAPKGLAALGAVDIVVYECSRFVAQQKILKQGKPRENYQLLRECIPGLKGIYLGGSHLTELVDRLKAARAGKA